MTHHTVNFVRPTFSISENLYWYFVAIDLISKIHKFSSIDQPVLAASKWWTLAFSKDTHSQRRQAACRSAVFHRDLSSRKGQLQSETQGHSPGKLIWFCVRGATLTVPRLWGMWGHGHRPGFLLDCNPHKEILINLYQLPQAYRVGYDKYSWCKGRTVLRKQSAFFPTGTNPPSRQGWHPQKRKEANAPAHLHQHALSHSRKSKPKAPSGTHDQNPRKNAGSAIGKCLSRSQVKVVKFVLFFVIVSVKLVSPWYTYRTLTRNHCEMTLEHRVDRQVQCGKCGWKKFLQNQFLRANAWAMRRHAARS